MKFSSSKRRVVLVLAAIVLLLFLLRPGASPLKSRIVLSISSGVGRPVDIGSVHLRLLPRPGFDLENLVVYDDPAFGAEPILRASEVTAALRLTALVRGRLEIARLDLTEPSLNLVHGTNGRWNLEVMLEHTAHSALAPTAKAKSAARAAFPYIQATSARINLKVGMEKKPYVLSNADFSLWQDSENTWGVRLKAQPLRTDLNLSDTGTLQLSGTWQRAQALRDTPLQFSMEWNRAQLGQLTKFISGNDLGWRGGVQLDVTLAGTPAKMLIKSDASIQDFRRYDITSGGALRLVAHCDGQYSTLDHGFHELACNAPVGNGLVSVKGEMGFPGSHDYALRLNAIDVPASALVSVAKHVKKNLPDDLVAEGLVHGNLSIEEDAAAKTALGLNGRGEITGLHLTSATNKAEIGPESVPFEFTSGELMGSIAKKKAPRNITAIKAADGLRVEFGPFPLAPGHGSGATVHGWVGRGGYGVSISGEADVAKTLRAGRMFGVSTMQTAAEGSAVLDLLVAGEWLPRSSGTAASFSAPHLTGTARLRNIHMAVREASGPIEIASADVQLLPEAVRVTRLSGRTAETTWTGSIEMPRGCGTPGSCDIKFTLHSSQIKLADLTEWAMPRAKERPWYRVLGSNQQTVPAFLQSLRASGRVIADRVQARNVGLSLVSANVELSDGKLRLSELAGEVLGGEHRGEWLIDFSGKTALCSGKGNIAEVSLDRFADAMEDAWVTGTATAGYQIKGACPVDFWKSAEGTFELDVRDGEFSHISLIEDGEPLRVTRLTGLAHLQDGAFEIKEAKLDSPSGKFQVSGTASLNRELEFKFTRGTNNKAAYTITGTLAEPRVVSVPNAETQAQLKTEPAK